VCARLNDEATAGAGMVLRADDVPSF